MKNSNSLRYRSLLLRGATALAISSLLLCGTGCRGGEDTGTELIQPTTTTEVMTTCTTFTSTSSTTSFTTTTTETETIAITTMVETISMTQPITESQTIAVAIEETPVVESEPVVIYPITEYERILLCNIVANEAGSDWISLYDKASVVACVINRVNSPDFPNTIEGVLTQPYQFSGYYTSSYYYPTVTDACVEAVNYYFNNPSEFGSWLYFEGDGINNYFH